MLDSESEHACFAACRGGEGTHAQHHGRELVTRRQPARLRQVGSQPGLLIRPRTTRNPDACLPLLSRLSRSLDNHVIIWPMRAAHAGERGVINPLRILSSHEK